MKRACPGCRKPMQLVFADKVELDWCGSCRGFWFDRGELAAALKIEGEIEVTRDQPASHCPACKGKRSQLLWTATIGGVRAMACLECAGSFVTESALKGRRSAKVPFVVRFVCVTCGDRYGLGQVREVKGALWCSRCAPPPPNVEKPKVETFIGRIARMLGWRDA